MEPYIGEIRQFAGNFAPSGWLLCQGQIVSIADYQTLFALIGTTYGGDGQNTFGLPDLRGRVPVHIGSGYVLGQAGGSETVTLSSAQLPAHSHTVACANTGGSDSPAGNVWGTSGANVYATAPAGAPMNPASVSMSGSNQPQPHANVQPYLAVNFIISMFGVYPSQN